MGSFVYCFQPPPRLPVCVLGGPFRDSSGLSGGRVMQPGIMATQDPHCLVSDLGLVFHCPPPVTVHTECFIE